MSWMEWFKGRTGGSPGQQEPAARPRKVSGSAASRRRARGGDAYDKEWVRVLDDNTPGRDPFNTYSWELDTDSGLPRDPALTRPQRAPGADPDDTYTWELQQGEASESDPWGLAEAEQKKSQAGVNPYDTGMFQTGWGERSKPR